jgi:hypothetical protein
VFINFIGGSGGHFIARLCHTLVYNTQLSAVRTNYYNMHRDETDSESSYGAIKDLFTNKVPQNPNLITNEQLYNFQENFLTENYPVYFCLNHIGHIKKFIEFFENSSIISIKYNKQDLSQIAYNFVNKGWNTEKEKLRALTTSSLTILRDQYGIEVAQDHIDLDDDKFLGWVYWLSKVTGNKNNLIKNPQFLSVNKDKLELNFNDIFSGNISSLLPQICEFLKVTPNTDTLNEANLLINNYSQSQIADPWNLSMDTYPTRIKPV